MLNTKTMLATLALGAAIAFAGPAFADYRDNHWNTKLDHLAQVISDSFSLPALFRAESTARCENSRAFETRP